MFVEQSNINNLHSSNVSGQTPQIMEIGVKEAFRPEDIELTSIDGNVGFHLTSVSSQTISSFTEYENDQELLQTTDQRNSYCQLQTVTENDKSPAWWRNQENSNFFNSPDFGQPPLPRFTDVFANGSFENLGGSNAESEEHPWQEIDLKITDECLFFDLSM
ncbi:unnamed protein product [Onchocerca flexuosa]|uniref:Clathrin_bdg domain-containing protein n=1 Tax=Onchocerca flexuosa TaxID=387005 RepID=A0A183HAV4_9BILA|nr:unnamed protein product [Onchocerca flexuosa]